MSGSRAGSCWPRRPDSRPDWLFAIWLFQQSYFVIGALCPYCMVLYVTTLAAFAALTRINILEGHLGAGTKRRLERPLRLGMDGASVVIILAIMASMMIYKYL